MLTPNEGLSRQHLDELHLSGFGFAQHFNKAQTPPRGTIEIIDINKLGDEMGEKTVAVEAFEGNNLVLVDEGHRGTGTAAGAWMSRRDALVRGGFAFEYSATFGQAVAKGLTVATAEEDIQKKRAKMLFETSSLKKLTAFELARLALTTEDKRRARMIATREIYAKCILFDYSYKYFYEDGYGKESLILYYPLLSLEDKEAVPLKMRPLAFDAPSEWEFVRDLEAFYNSAPGKEAIGKRSLYLLRNADSEAKGLGFALAGNFYPDFLLWLVDDNTGEQWLFLLGYHGCPPRCGLLGSSRCHWPSTLCINDLCSLASSTTNRLAPS